MKRLTAIICCLVTLLPLAQAATYDSEQDSTVQAAQLRVSADWTKKWNSGVRLGIEEELRFDLFNSALGSTFSRSHTTLSLAYAPIPYFKMDAGYTLRILGTKDWNDYNEWLRHRVFFGVTGSYKWDIVKLFLRERFVCDIRTDSVNLLEKNQYDWHLRSRLGAEFTVPSKPLKPYIWCELINTLNATEYQQKNGHQFISDMRAQAGVKWRITRQSALDFYYRFNYGYDRDINITRKKQLVELTEQTTLRHIIGVAYNFGW